MTPPKIKIYVDASSLRDIACWRKYYLQIVQGYQLTARRRANFKAAYGTAFHRFLEEYYRGVLPIKDCITTAMRIYEPFDADLPLEEFRTTGHLLQSIKKYIQENPKESEAIVPKTFTVQGEDGKQEKVLEQQFCIPWWNNNKFEIALCGTVDMHCEYFGTEVLMDHKTTATKINFIDSYLEEYEMSNQLQFYAWTEKVFRGHQTFLPGVINGIFLKKQTIKNEKLGIFDGVQFKRSNIINFSDKQMLDFERWFMRKMNELIKSLDDSAGEELWWNYERSFCKAGWEKCVFWNVCKHGGEELQKQVLETFYDRQEYNPLKFKEQYEK